MLVHTVDDQVLETKDAKRLFLYSKKDDLIPYQDVEDLSGQTEEKGYGIKRVVFGGIGHVRHRQKFPEKYWNSVKEA